MVEVDGDVASILTHSRFADDFTFQPPGGPSGPCGVSPKVSDMFKFKDVNMPFCDLSFAGGQCVSGINL